MNRVLKIVELLRRVRRKHELAAFAMAAALLFFSAMPATAQDHSTNTYTGATIVHGGSLGLVPGQRVSVTAPNFYFLDGSVRFVKHSIKVYARDPNHIETQSKLVYSGESGGLGGYGHIFNFRYSDLSVVGEPGTDRVQAWIEVESFAMQNTSEDSGAHMWPPIFELIDELSGRTVSLQRSNAKGKSVMLSLRPRPELAFDGFGGFHGGVSVGAVEGQTVRLTVDVFDNASSGGGDGIVTKASAFAHVKVFNTTTGALLMSRDFTSLSAGLNTIDINRDNLREEGEANTGRIQLWIEVVMDLRQAPGVTVSAPTWEVFENNSGSTTVSSQKFWHPTDFKFVIDGLDR